MHTQAGNYDTLAAHFQVLKRCIQLCRGRTVHCHPSCCCWDAFNSTSQSHAFSPRAHQAELSDSWRRWKHNAFPRQRGNPTLHTSHIHLLLSYGTGFYSTNKHLYGNAQTHTGAQTLRFSWQLAQLVAFSPPGLGINSIQEVLLFINPVNVAVIISESDSQHAHSST